MTDVAEIERSDMPPALREQMDMARALAFSTLIPGHLRNKPADVFVVMQAAVALDVPAWTACQELFVINGKVGYSASLMRALILRAGHRIESITDDGDTATITAIRRGDPTPKTASFSVEDADRAGLNTNVWKAYPRAMRVARATSILFREHFSDVAAGMSSYTVEELGGDPSPADLAE